MSCRFRPGNRNSSSLVVLLVPRNDLCPNPSQFPSRPFPSISVTPVLRNPECRDVMQPFPLKSTAINHLVMDHVLFFLCPAV